MQPEPQRVGPVSLSERIVFVDVLRGMTRKEEGGATIEAPLVAP